MELVVLRWMGGFDYFDDEVGHVHFDFEFDKVHERVELHVAVGRRN